MSVVLEPTEHRQAAATEIERPHRARVVSRAFQATKRLVERAAGFAIAWLRGTRGR